MSYEICRTAGNRQRIIRRSNVTPDGRTAFRTFREAKQHLSLILEIDIFHAQEMMLSLRANQAAIRRLNKADADSLQKH